MNKLEEILTGWQGKGTIEIDWHGGNNIEDFRDRYKDEEIIIIAIGKEKPSDVNGEIKRRESKHTIKGRDLYFIWDLIKTNCEIGEQYDYKFLVRKLIEKRYNEFKPFLEQYIKGFKEFNKKIKDSIFGNEWEELCKEILISLWFAMRKEYFVMYHYCIRLLEKWEYIQYFGRGSIIRLEE